MRLRFGQPRPCKLGIGEDDSRNRARLKCDVVPRDHFDGDAAFVRRLVREHRLAHDVADRKNRRLRRAHLLVDLDEAAIAHLHARALEPRNAGVRPPSGGNEDALEDRLAGNVARGLALECHTHALGFGFHLHHSRVEQHRLHRLADAFGKHVDQIAIGAGEQA